MTLIGLVVTIILIGLLLWLVNTYIPMAAPIKTVLNVVVVIILVIWLLQMLTGVGNLRIGP